VQQDKAVGHAVRAMYLYTAMADLALKGDPELEQACLTLYENVVNTQMHIIGAVGSAARGEAFTNDYDLPPDSVYGETCASIGLMMFTQRLYQLHGKAAYLDTMERALYNTVLAGISLSGREFFYVNPLETHPDHLYCNPDLAHVRIQRQSWFACACCPPNLARAVLSLGDYAYDACDQGITLKLYVSGQLQHGTRQVQVTTGYPYEGQVQVVATGGTYKLRLRSPQHAPITALTIDGQAQELHLTEGWLVLERDWQGETVLIYLDIRPKVYFPHGAARHLRGRLAVQAGPLVYCAEGRGVGLHGINEKTTFTPTAAPVGLPEGVVAYTVATTKQVIQGGELYATSPPTYEESQLLLLPYHLWGNLGEYEMTVYFWHR